MASYERYSAFGLGNHQSTAMRTALEFKNEIMRKRPIAQGQSQYGSRVMPVLELYKGLASYEDKRSFQDALELLLKSGDEDERAFAVDVCLGFFVFRDAI